MWAMMQKLRMIAGSVRPTRGGCAELNVCFRSGWWGGMPD